MRNKYHSGHAYEAFDTLIKSVEVWFSRLKIKSTGFSNSLVKERLVQSVVELTFFEFVRLTAGKVAEGGHPELDQQNPFICNGIVIQPNEGRVSISPGLFLRNVMTFIVHWVHVLIFSVGYRRDMIATNPDSFTIVFGVGSESLLKDGDSKHFELFCQQGPIAPLREAHCLLVQSLHASHSDGNEKLQFHRFPLHLALRRSRLGIRARIGFVMAHLLWLVKFLYLIIRQPLLSNLHRDFAYLAMVDLLDSQNKIAAVVLTNSNYMSQPLWLRNHSKRQFSSHMVWYAQNVIPLVFRQDRLVSHYPAYRHLAVDHHWVWTKLFADYLCALGLSAETHPVGPVLWCLSEDQVDMISVADTDARTIVLFDVTPVRDEVADRSGFLNNYYNPQVMRSFIEDIVAAVSRYEESAGTKCNILLKTKRGYNSGHDQGYVDLLDRLEKSGRITILPHQVNLYSLLKASALSIVIPNSSPALVAAGLGKYSIYYDPTEEIAASCESGPFIGFASGKDDLYLKMLDVLGT